MKLGLMLLAAVLLGTHRVSAAEALGLRVPAGVTRIEERKPGQPPLYAVVPVIDYSGDEVPVGPYQQVHALCVGVNNYAGEAFSPLSNAVNDATTLGEILRSQVAAKSVVLTNELATLEGIRAALHQIGKRSGPGDLFIFHFSGHGIGLVSGVGQYTGRLLLHDAPPLVDGKAVGTSNGVIEMRLIEKMIEAAGIRAKHRLLIFDACYSGLGVQTRDTFGSKVRPSADEQNSVDTSLAYRATYLITAGGGRHLVLDRGRTYPEHGLLTGFVIDAIQNPEAAGLKTVPYADRRYLSAPELFLHASRRVIGEAGQILRGGFEQWREQRTSIAMKGRIGGPIETIFKAAAADARVLTRAIQNPQDDRIRGEGRVYLPIGNAIAPAPPVPIRPSLREELVSRYGSEPYATELLGVLEMLEKSRPPVNGATSVISIKAELEWRPHISASRVRDFVDIDSVAAKNGLSRRDREELSKHVFLELERIRNGIEGGKWQPVAQAGQAVSAHQELRLKMHNAGTKPVHYYLASLDQSGIFQWLAPENDSPGNEEYGRKSTFGPKSLPAGEGLEFPPEVAVGKGKVSFGWQVTPSQDPIRQVFILIACEEPWLELEKRLSSASRLGFSILKAQKQKGAGETPLGAVLPTLPTVRAVNPVEMLLEEEPATTTIGDSEIAQVSRNGFMIMTWSLEVKPPHLLQVSMISLEKRE